MLMLMLMRVLNLPLYFDTVMMVSVHHLDINGRLCYMVTPLRLRRPSYYRRQYPAACEHRISCSSHANIGIYQDVLKRQEAMQMSVVLWPLMQ